MQTIVESFLRLSIFLLGFFHLFAIGWTSLPETKLNLFYVLLPGLTLIVASMVSTSLIKNYLVGGLLLIMSTISIFYKISVLIDFELNEYQFFTLVILFFIWFRSTIIFKRGNWNWEWFG